MKDLAKRKALIEEYGRTKTMPKKVELEMRKRRVVEAYKGFCSPYPFLVPGVRRAK